MMEDQFLIEISLADVLKYIGDSQRMLREGEIMFVAKTFCIKLNFLCFSWLGEEVFKGQHIIHAGVKQNRDILVVCLRSSSPDATPHEINVVLDENVNN